MRLREVSGSCDATQNSVSDARTEGSGTSRWRKIRGLFGKKVGDLSDAGKLENGETEERGNWGDVVIEKLTIHHRVPWESVLSREIS